MRILLTSMALVVLLSIIGIAAMPKLQPPRDTPGPGGGSEGTPPDEGGAALT